MKLAGEETVHGLGLLECVFMSSVNRAIWLDEREVLTMPVVPLLIPASAFVEVQRVVFHPFHGRMFSGLVVPGSGVDECRLGRERHGVQV